MANRKAAATKGNDENSIQVLKEDTCPTSSGKSTLTYNIGVGAFCRSTARRRLNAGNVRGACDAATWFNKAGGRKIPGLVNRRTAEHKLCLEGLR